MHRHATLRPEVEDLKPTTSMVRWDESEKDAIAKKTWELRKDHPDHSIIALVNKAQAVLPEDRRRNINSMASIPYITSRLRKIDEGLKVVDDEARAARETARQVMEQNETLRHQASSNTRDAILISLSDEEMMKRYADRVMKQLAPIDLQAWFSPEDLLGSIPLPKVAAYVSEQFVSQMLGMGGMADIMAHMMAQQTTAQIHQQPHPKLESKKPDHGSNGHHRTKPKLPRVIIVGPKSEQGQILQRRLDGVVELTYIDKNLKRQIPEGYDLYVVWTRFTSHSIQDAVIKAAGDREKVMLHSGGLETLSARIIETFALQPA